ncbi:hypothetical protein L9F63_018240, partial [Diploptera punctata]
IFFQTFHAADKAICIKLMKAFVTATYKLIRNSWFNLAISILLYIYTYEQFGRLKSTEHVFKKNMYRNHKLIVLTLLKIGLKKLNINFLHQVTLSSPVIATLWAHLIRYSRTKKPFTFQYALFVEVHL